MPTNPAKDPNEYFIDAENAAEMARLLYQDHLTTQGMGGTIPERTDFSTIHGVLDIGCGPGGWVHDVAYEHPKIQITGIDISRTMVEYAHTHAFVQGLNNAHFRVMDATKPLDFPDGSFDIVNTRFIFSFMLPTTWPALMDECVRITRPGGIIRLTESEWYLTNSLGHETLHGMMALALKKAGKGYSPDGRNVGITPMLGQFLQQAKCQHIQHMAHMLDYSAGTEAWSTFYQNTMAFFQLVKPFILSMKVTTDEEFESLYNLMLAEIQLDSFRGISFVLTMWGERPAS
ncbi:MAG TPA: class I SAM-dependent methyltransferase [Ktedonobacteraceae bacterium]|nr:class I SAM-dependent methyltransferase [Ktedonobacteraceae bacterium]